MNSPLRKKFEKYICIISLFFYFVLFGRETGGNTITARIEGIVTDMQGAPISDADITLYLYGNDEAIDGSRSDMEGRFIIGNISVDSIGYYLEIDHGDGAIYPKQYWHQFQNTTQIPNKRIRLRPGNIFNVHIQLTSSPLSIDDTTLFDLSSIRGSVFNESGQRLSGIGVAAIAPGNIVETFDIFASQHVIISGVGGGTGPSTDCFVNKLLGVGGTFTVSVNFNNVHIGGNTQQLCMVTPKSPSGLAYYVLEQGSNTVSSRNGEFSFFFIDQATKSDNSGTAEVTISGPASENFTLSASQHVIISGVGGGTGPSTDSFVNKSLNQSGSFDIYVTFENVHIGGTTDQLFVVTPKSPSGLAYYVLEQGTNTVSSGNGEFSFFFIDQATKSDNSGKAVVEILSNEIDVSNLNIVDSTVTDLEGKFILYRVPALLPHFLVCFPPPNSNLDYPQQFWAQDTMTSYPQQEVRTESYTTLDLGELILLRQPSEDTINQNFAQVKIVLLDSVNNPVRNSCYLSLMKGTFVTNKSLESGFLDTFIVFNDVSEGNYSLYLDVDGYPQQYYNPHGKNTINNIHEFHVNAGEEKYIDVRLTQDPINGGAANFSGYIKNSAGEPVVNVKVLVLDTLNLFGDVWINISHHWTEFSAVTDNNGYYTIYDVRPGRYVLLAGSETENYQTVFYPNSPLIKDATPLKIIDNSTEITANFTLIPGSEVIGYVKNESGIGLSNISVTLFRSGNDDSTKKRALNLFFETRSDINGKFKFRGIPEGKWHINTHDTSEIYLFDHHHWEDFSTNGTNSTFVDNIIMKAGGSLYGTYTISDDSIHHGHLGNIFIYSETLSDTVNSDEDWSGWHTSIYNSDEPGKYRTHAIPAGRWKMVISPNPYSHTGIANQSYNQNFIPSFRWSYIDGATSLGLSNTIVIESYKRTYQNIAFQSGGHLVFGSIRTENNEQLGNTNTLISNYRHYHVRAYIKEGDRLIQISESHDIGNNRFVLSGLVEGEAYYFNANAKGYVDQWWNAIPDSSTCKEKNAADYPFSTTEFLPLNIYLMKEPEGYNEEHHVRPPALKNQTIIPLGLTSVLVHWSPSAAEDNVVKYLVYKLKKAKKDMFQLNKWGWWEPVNDDSLFAHLDSFFVTDTFFIDTVVFPGVNYMYVAVGIDDKNQEGEALPKGVELDSYIIKITHETFKKVTETVNPEHWQMVGICGLDSVILDSTRTQIKLFRWDETADSSKLHSFYQKIDTLTPGSGAWIYSYKKIPLYMSRNSFSILVTKKDSITLTLNKGWNQVSSPFPYGVTPGWIVNDFVSYGWNPVNNSYYETKSLRPWKAYWIYSAVDTVLKVSPIPTAVRKNLLSKRRGDDGWELSVKLIGKISSDPENYVGIISRELSARRIQESPEPPQAFDFPQLYFTHGTEKLSKHYAVSDAIPAKKLEWKVGISPTVEKMDIIVDGISSVPEPVSLFWVTNFGAQDLRVNNSINLTPNADSRYGYIVATANPFDIALYTGRFLLRNNYPNPFKKSTLLEFTIPFNWSKNGSKSENQSVSLKVYNIAGQQVATLHSGKIAVGHHRKVWDGKNNLGQSLPSGVYIARLKSVKFSKTIQMFKIK